MIGGDPACTLQATPSLSANETKRYIIQRTGTMPQQRRSDTNGHGRKAIKELDVLHEGWVLKKKRKKMQGE